MSSDLTSHGHWSYAVVPHDHITYIHTITIIVDRFLQYTAEGESKSLTYNEVSHDITSDLPSIITNSAIVVHISNEIGEPVLFVLVSWALMSFTAISSIAPQQEHSTKSKPKCRGASHEWLLNNFILKDYPSLDELML